MSLARVLADQPRFVAFASLMRPHQLFPFGAEGEPVDMAGHVVAAERRQLLQFLKSDRKDVLKDLFGSLTGQFEEKGIVIGEKGAALREVGRQAREDMERLFDRKVFLQTWVKVREGWSDDERALRGLGYADPAS